MYSIRKSLESIAFQDKEFGNVLAGLIDNLSAIPSNKKKKDSNEYKEITKLIKDRLGLKIELIVDDPMIDAACYPGVWFNINNVMQQKDWRDHEFLDFVDPTRKRQYEKRYKDFIKYKKDNWVDTKNAKVHGYFTEHEFEVFMNFNQLTAARLTPKEMAAVLMHELGHIFTFIEYFDRTIETNQTLACVLASLEEVDGDASNPKHIYRLKELDNVNETTFEDDLENTTSKEVITTVVFDQFFRGKKLQSNLDTSNYNDTAGESQADVFSVRFGLGRDLATGLYKIHKHFGDPAVSLIGLMGSYFFQLCIILLSLMTINPVIIGLVFFMGYLNSEHKRDYTYDDLPVRLSRMKEQLVTELKNPKLSNKDKEEITKSIKNLETLIKGSYKNKFMLGYLFDLITPGARREKKAIEVQRKLEELAANDLFTKAAELSLVKI